MSESEVHGLSFLSTSTILTFFQFLPFSSSITFGNFKAGLSPHTLTLNRLKNSGVETNNINTNNDYSTGMRLISVNDSTPHISSGVWKTNFIFKKGFELPLKMPQVC